MRYFETILKLLFLGGAVLLMITGSIGSRHVLFFLAISALLGIVLIFNKDASYHFTQTKKDLLLRRIEGAVLICAAICGFLVYQFIHI